MSGREHDALFDRAFNQYGLVTDTDAQQLGIDPRGLAEMESCGTLEKVARGLYRYCDQLMEAALWPKGIRGVLSHETALELHNLCAVKSTKIHITVPRWHRIDREVPATYTLHHRDLKRSDLAIQKGYPTVAPRRAILDVIETHLEAKLVEQAIDAARHQDLVCERDLREFEARARGSEGLCDRS
jgi:predicted transcriptional regulator of viral defense system